MLRPSGVLAILALSCFTLPCLAWSPRTRVSMVEDAIKLMPKSLRMALEKNREAVLRGALGPMVTEDAPEHRAPWAEGKLDQQVEAEARGLIDVLSKRTQFADLSERFGRLGHYVMDAGFPPGVAGAGGDTRYAHFAEFCESRLPKFRLVFYGHEDEAIEDDDFVRFAESVMQRARDEDRELARAYAAAGDPPAASAFDDRSIPFAVGSLAYSHTVTDIVRAWLAAWRLGGGDVGRTPYLEAAPAKSAAAAGATR